MMRREQVTGNREQGTGNREQAGRSGSALLIVLGMLSFMVVSAVSFSIYMRQTRLPSSYLRRNIAARQLVRAALARAIEELEGDFNDNANWGKYELSETDVARRFYGIYDDPYPGRGTDSQYDETENGDLWFRRVFMPFGPVKYPECTVPTLTLEALAYLPPAIIDDVRKFSRYSRTGAWRSLPYDAGRYAYTAVNVSDLFDINRLCADEPRDSGANRVSLLTLSASTKDDPTDIDTGRATQLHNALSKWESSGIDAPFVSLADFNLLAGNTDFSPFMSYIGKTSTTLLKQGNAGSANALFITDTWFPAATSVATTSGGGSGPTVPASSTKTYDLAVDQPFKNFNARQYDQVPDCRTPEIGEIFEKNLGVGLFGLYDYLDSDSRPVSLCLPTVEAVPMVAGVSCPAMLKPAVEERDADSIIIEIPNPNYTPDNGQPEKWKIERTWSKLTFTGFGNVVQSKVLLTYPFKRMLKTGRYKGNHKLRGLLRVFAAPANLGCRPTDPNGNLYPSQNLWANGVAPKNGVATFLSDTPSISAFNKDVKTTDDAIDDSLAVKFRCTGIDMPILWKVDERCTNGQGPDGFEAKTYLSLDGLKNNDATFRPLDLDGKVDGNWSGLSAKAQFEGSKQELGVVTDSLGGFSGQYRLYTAMWVQVLDGSGNVVDMAPAVGTDDAEWLGVSTATVRTTPYRRQCGSYTPLLHFCADFGGKPVTFTPDIKTDLDGKLADYSDWKSLYAVDPRFNAAPENWFSKTDATVSKDVWKQALGLDTSPKFLGQKIGGLLRDRDIFMFVSDQEYLQDIGELQFLPYLRDMDGGGTFADTYGSNFHGESFKNRTDPINTGAFADGTRFWRTYTAYNNGDGTDPIYALPPNDIRFHSGIGGFKLNPYSDDNRVIAAALVGTPFDYYVASTNENQTQSGGNRNTLGASLNMNNVLSQYSFGESDVAKMDPDDVLSIMDEIRDSFYEVAKNGGRDWEAAWNDLEWQVQQDNQINDNNKRFIFDQDLADASSCPLHQVDRKFLYSYWRECFDNRQQLFLIFVRAEPMSAAAGSVGKGMPSSQLGGRAVALVWRDPAVPSYVKSNQRKTRAQIRSDKNAAMDNRESVAPHRTRVLFYHQFD